jgi:CHASE3 domain sensor protein
MREFLKKNAIHLAIGLVSLLIIIGGIFSIINRSTMHRSLTVKDQTEAVLREVDLIHDNMRFMDISSRGYALIRKDEYVFWNVESARGLNRRIFRHLDSLFAIQGFEHAKYEDMESGLNTYATVFEKMLTHLKNEETGEYLKLLEHDYGKSFYVSYTPLLDEIAAFEKQLATSAQDEYATAMDWNMMVQTLLILVGLPTLFWLFYRIRSDERERKELLLDLEQNNRKYLFDSGRELDQDVKQILNNSIVNLQQASRFVGEISVGNYEVRWEELKERNEALNKENLAGKLVFMRDEMKRIKEEDRKRIWTTQGLSDISEIIRKHQTNLKELTWHVLTFLVKYLNSQQGSLFVTRHENQTACLSLEACYAFERRKFVDKVINPGEGLIGEAFLSGQSALLKSVPAGYISITSGLGDATPSCIVIVPMKHNDEVMAVVEIASFNVFESYQIAFLEKAGEFLASAISTAAQDERNKIMMEQLSTQTEQLRAQEEELRQNIEELETTQEVMRRQSDQR